MSPAVHFDNPGVEDSITFNLDYLGIPISRKELMHLYLEKSRIQEERIFISS
jgi:hypothetical protein